VSATSTLRPDEHMASLSDARRGSSGFAVTLVRGRPRLAPGFTAEHEGKRRYVDLASVAAVPPGRAGRRVQYWTFVGVAEETHRDVMRQLPLSYDVTVMAARPMGWERAKTHGHVHVSRGVVQAGFPELYEVLVGRAGFLIQNIHPGPTSTYAVLVEATAGQVVALPPLLHHVTVNLGDGPLVVADVTCRASEDDYGRLRAAHGMAHHIGIDDRAVPNPAYQAAPSLERVTAEGWSGPSAANVYRDLVDRPASLAWLCSPEGFAARFPDLWHRVEAHVRP